MSTQRQHEDPGHLKLKRTVSSIFERCGFLVDTEVHLDLDGDGRSDLSFDVCALCEERNEFYLIAIECKNQTRLPHISKEMSAWRENRRVILANSSSLRVVQTDKNKVSEKHFQKIKDIILGYAFTDKLSVQTAKVVERSLKRASIVLWDSGAVRYFDKVSKAIEVPIRYEVYREFDIFKSGKEPIPIEAVRVKQPGFPEMFLLGMSPGLLLRIGYVLRRISKKPLAYQRVINAERVRSIRKFISGRAVLLPNSVIIAFDSDPEVQRRISYDGRFLKVPLKYCCAWIVDGQHRIYGFAKTKYDRWPAGSDEFKLPVVAFRNLEEALQNKTFVNINYYQKKIDPTLFCDLSTAVKDLKNELTWPSLLGVKLNETEPWLEKIKISEFDTKKPITLSSFARYALLETLLGYNKGSDSYSGPLFTYAPFDPHLRFESPKNQAAFREQFGILRNFFFAVKQHTVNSHPAKNPWVNFSDYALTKATGVNALLLVLSRILMRYNTDFHRLDPKRYLYPLKKVDFGSDRVAKFGGGWKGFRGLANYIITKLNKHNRDRLRRFPKRSKT